MIAHHAYSVHHYMCLLSHIIVFDILLMMLYDLYVYMPLSINELFCHTSVYSHYAKRELQASKIYIVYISKILLVIINVFL